MPVADERLVTVVVTTRNSAETLPACLGSIRAQTYEPIELIVVDNISCDATADNGRTYEDRFQEAGPERSAQRNLGVDAGSGAYVFVVDSDMVLTSTVVERCVEEIRAQDVAAVIVPERSIGDGWWAACKALERSCYVGDETIEAPRFFERSTFERYGGYDEQMTGPEDWDLPARMRPYEQFGRVESEILHLEGRLTLGSSLRKKYYYGKGVRLYAKRHPELMRRQVLRPAFARHWRRLIRTPALSASMIFMKAAELTAGAAGFAADAFDERRRGRDELARSR
jgi:glycosyltransferase involved in cell wall biosynthesis